MRPKSRVSVLRLGLLCLVSAWAVHVAYHLRRWRPAPPTGRGRAAPSDVDAAAPSVVDAASRGLNCSRYGGATHQRLTVGYFAVGRNTLAKATRSALSARRAHRPARIRTLVVSDDAGAHEARAQELACGFGAFDEILSVGNTTDRGRSFSSVPEFIAFRTYNRNGRLRRTHAAWNKPDEDNDAVASLRLAKIHAASLALAAVGAGGVLALLDADTVVCAPLDLHACAAVAAGADVAFVEVAVARRHASEQLSRLFGVGEETPEANTGALILQKTPGAVALLRDWAETYAKLRTASPPQLMDQVAFRAALHRTGAKTARLGESANCRGRDFVTRAHASLGCDGLPQPPARAKASAAGRGGSPEDSPEDSHKSRLGALKVEAMLRGGEKCDVLHSHDATDLSHVEDARAGKCEGWWLSVPFAAAATPAAEATVRSAPKFAASHFRVHSRASSRRCFAGAIVVLRDPFARLALEFESCCGAGGRGAGARPPAGFPGDWCAGVECAESLAAFAEKRGNVALARLSLRVDACPAAKRPVPNRADLRIALGRLRGARLVGVADAAGADAAGAAQRPANPITWLLSTTGADDPAVAFASATWRRGAVEAYLASLKTADSRVRDAIQLDVELYVALLDEGEMNR